MRVGISLVIALMLAGSAGAQTPEACGLSSIHEGAALVYPPIARAAHVQGTVLLMVNFAADGSVLKTQALAGAEMLRNSALRFTSHLHANQDIGPRECQVAVQYVLGPQAEHPALSFEWTSMQHVRITVDSPVPDVQYSVTSNPQGNR